MNPTCATHPSLLALLLIVTTATGLQAAGTADPPPSAAQPASAPTHILFMGVDVAVHRDDQVLPVRDVQGSALIVKVKGEEIAIPTRGKPFAMKVTRALKVASQSATLDKMTVERGYSPGNDPFKKFVSNAGAAAGADAVVSLAQGELIGAMLNHDYDQMAAARGAAVDLDASREVIQQKNTAYLNTVNTAQVATMDSGTAANELSGDLAEEAFDALIVSFDVSSSTPMDNAYVVVLAELRSGEGATAARHNWVYAKSLGEVGPDPRPVYIKQIGFPPGFVIEKHEIHLFDSGQEVATNFAPMRAELSKEEAFEYAAIDYVSRNKDATLPAGLAVGQNTEALRRRLADAYDGGPVYVEVARTGKVGRTFRDKDAAEPLDDAELDSILRELRFNPALSKGRAIDSVVKVKASPERT